MANSLDNAKAATIHRSPAKRAFKSSLKAERRSVSVLANCLLRDDACEHIAEFLDAGWL